MVKDAAYQMELQKIKDETPRLDSGISEKDAFVRLVFMYEAEINRCIKDRNMQNKEAGLKTLQALHNEIRNNTHLGDVFEGISIDYFKLSAKFKHAYAKIK